MRLIHLIQLLEKLDEGLRVTELEDDVLGKHRRQLYGLEANVDTRQVLDCLLLIEPAEYVDIVLARLEMTLLLGVVHLQLNIFGCGDGRFVQVFRQGGCCAASLGLPFLDVSLNQSTLRDHFVGV